MEEKETKVGPCLQDFDNIVCASFVTNICTGFSELQGLQIILLNQKTRFHRKKTLIFATPKHCLIFVQKENFFKLINVEQLYCRLVADFCQPLATM